MRDTQDAKIHPLQRKQAPMLRREREEEATWGFPVYRQKWAPSMTNVQEYVDFVFTFVHD
jgi:hypothetical protein